MRFGGFIDRLFPFERSFRSELRPAFAGPHRELFGNKPRAAYEPGTHNSPSATQPASSFLGHVQPSGRRCDVNHLGQASQSSATLKRSRSSGM